MVERTCWLCSETKPEDQFTKKHGKIENLCRPCAVRKAAKWSKNNPEKRRAIWKRWAEKNRERHNQQAREWTARNPQAKKQSADNWVTRNPERRRQVANDYAKRNPDKLNANYNRRRARIIGNGGRHTPGDIRTLYSAQGGKCANAACRVSISGRRYHVDHIVPLVRGGTDNPDNLQLLCRRCNSRKHAKPPERWAKENGLLFV